MTTTVDKSIEVSVPARLVYDQWTQFEEFPKFMSGVSEVTQIDDKTIHWVAEIGGVRREWDATVLEQNPDRKVAWTAISGATNAGAVYFTPLGPDRTEVRLVLDYEPEGLLETIGDKLDVVERRAERDLESFKRFIEERQVPTGAWRGSIPGDVGTPDTTSSTAHGDSGKAGVSGKVIAAGATAAAAVAGAVAATRGKARKDDDEVVDDAAPSFSSAEVIAVEDDYETTATMPPSSSEDDIALEATRERNPDR